MQDMDESQIESRIHELENSEIPHAQILYNTVLQKFLNAGGFPASSLHLELDNAKEAYMSKLLELEDLKNILSYMSQTE